MSTRVKGCIVSFDHTIREDDAEESVLQAIRQIRGVNEVTTVEADASDWIVRSQVKRDVYNAMWDALNKATTGG